jgi:hypothetical protein
MLFAGVGAVQAPTGENDHDRFAPMTQCRLDRRERLVAIVSTRSAPVEDQRRPKIEDTYSWARCRANDESF